MKEKKMYLIEELKQICLSIAKHNLSFASSGNLSIIQEDKILITPKGHWFETPIETFCEVSLNGEIISGTPSIETEMHLEIYRQRKDIKTVLHCQSVFVTTLCCSDFFWDKLNLDLIPEISFYLKKIEKIRFFEPGSTQLAKEIGKKFSNNEVTTVLMQNHGVVLGSKDLKTVLQNALFLELASNIFLELQKAKKILP